VLPNRLYGDEYMLPAADGIVELEIEAIGCEIEVGLAGMAGAAPAVLVVVEGLSTAVTEDDATEAGAAGIDAEVLLLLETTAPARSQGFGGDGMWWSGLGLWGNRLTLVTRQST